MYFNVPQGGNLSWATVTATHSYNKPHKIYTEYIDNTNMPHYTVP